MLCKIYNFIPVCDRVERKGIEREREREGRGRWGYFKPNDITVVNISDLQSS